MNNKFKPRKRNHRAFMEWYRKNKKDFKIPLEFEKHKDGYIEFSFVGINKAIKVSVTYDISVWVHIEDEIWDGLICIDFPRYRRTETGFSCPLCEPKSYAVFPTKSAMFDDHLRYFLNWVNDDLASAKFLVIKGTKEDPLSASLSNEVPKLDQETHVLELRLNPTSN